jgi:type IV secretion system protein VirB10
MIDRPDLAEPPPGEGLDVGSGEHTLSPLPGEAGIPNVAASKQSALPTKRQLAVGLLVASALTICALAVHRAVGHRSAAGSADAQPGRNRPAAASAEPRKLDMASAPAPAASVSTQVPAIAAVDDAEAEPIGVRRSGEASPRAGAAAPPRPEDAPVLLVSKGLGQGPRPTMGGPAEVRSAATAWTDAPHVDASDPLAVTSRNLQAYQQQLAALLDKLTQSAELASPAAPAPEPARIRAAAAPGSGAPGEGAAGGQPQPTRRVVAGSLGNRSLTLPKGTAFTCALKTRVISAAAGLIGCQVQRNVFSDDGRVLLIERGAHMDGEYRITGVRPGSVRIPVLWTRIRTPHGVTVDVDSPATGQLGESGIDGHVDNRWTERIGAAMLLSLIDDSVKLVIENQAHERQADTLILPSTTANGSKLAEKVLDSTINIPPLIYRNQGGIVGIYVAHDVDFSGVYELQPASLTPVGESR